MGRHCVVDRIVSFLGPDFPLFHAGGGGAGGVHNLGAGREDSIPESREDQICNPAPGVGGAQQGRDAAPVPRAGVTSCSAEVQERRSLPSAVLDGGGAAGSAGGTVPAPEGEGSHQAGGVSGRDIVSCFVKLSGLVWTATEADIRLFLSDCTIKRVEVVRDGRGRALGEAVVEVAGEEGEARALAHPGQRLGALWVTVAR